MSHQSMRTREELSANVAHLKQTLAQNPLVEQGALLACRAELERLREVFRQTPALFSAELVSELRGLALKLGQHQSPRTPVRVEPELVLKQVFGYESFRPGQRELVEAVLRGRDALGILPTGAGKSLIYQVPARILGGLTVVVSPLIALMKDQVDALSEVGLRATFLNSSLSADERRERVRRLRGGEIEIVYCAPEGLEAWVGQLLSSLKVNLIAVDEAHCISEWGHDFRPAYRGLSGLKRRFGKLPMLALTASATGQVARDICEQLGLVSPLCFRGSFFRPNLRLFAYAKGEALGLSARKSILQLVQSRPGDSGIVYCLSRKTAQATAEFLESNGVRAGFYHAGLETNERSRVQEAFQNEALDVVVATIAFGMGIDKSNVRYVIHQDMPRSIEGYYQEFGRAGRDGVASDCVLFYSWSEVKAYDRFAEALQDSRVAELQRAQARQVYRLAEGRECRHAAIARHFGEQLAACGTACDVCSGSDVLAEARAGAARRGPRRVESAIVRRAPPSEQRAVAPALAADATAVDSALYERLKNLRRELAQSRKVPAYVVFSDATLLEMAAHRPCTPAALLAISGVGPAKLERYGAAFLATIRGEG